MRVLTTLTLVVGVLSCRAAITRAADDLARLEQQAFSAAADAVADSVVQIQTIGGLDRLAEQSLSQGATTGLIIDVDGHIVSSAFNFAQQPTSILVRLPSGEQRPAEIVGRDTSRMLVLLKVEPDDQLPVPEAAPMDEVRPGDWAVAIGRTYSAQQVNLSVGVVSAVNRMHGRALQTDANVSASNYGGPLVDIRGRVLGVLVPMAPQVGGGSETSAVAGSEFYDSGIGFAVPLEHVLAVLDRWKDDKDLKRGLLGVSLKPGNPHSTPAMVTAVWPRSPAAEAGWKPKDRIIAVAGKPIASQTDLRFQVATHYASDELQVTIRRGRGDDAEEIETRVTLADELPAYQHAFLGVLPSRAPPESRQAEDEEVEPKADAAEVAPAAESDSTAADGVVVRRVWPDSPADRAKVQPGDRITQLGEEEVNSIGEAIEQLNAQSPGDNLAVQVTRGEEELSLDVELTSLPEEILSSSELRGDDDDNPEAGGADEPKLEELKLPEMSQTARYYQPAGGRPPSGLLVWLSDGSDQSAKALAQSWQRTCRRDGLILLMPAPADIAGWSSDDLEYLARLMQTAARRFDVDPRRVIVAGEGKAGQFAYAFAFPARKLIRGVVAVDSPLPRTLELPDNSPNERLAILSVESPDSSLAVLIRQDREKLAEAGYPTTQISRSAASSERAALDSATLAKIARWIDGLDRF